MFPTQVLPKIFDAVNERLKAGGAVALAGEMLGHASCAVGFLKLGHELADGGRGFDDRVRVAEACSSSDPTQVVLAIGVGQRVRLAQVLGFEFLAGNPDQSVGPTALQAQIAQSSFQDAAVAAVVIPQHHEPDAGCAPGA